MGIILEILTTNYSGQLADIIFSPCSGADIDIGQVTLPYNYDTENYYGVYSIYLPKYNKTCELVVPCLSSTPTHTPTMTPTMTPTPTHTPTMTPTTTMVPTPGASPSQTPAQTQTPTITMTPTQTQTPTPTLTITPTNTQTPTPTKTPPLPSIITYLWYWVVWNKRLNNSVVVDGISPFPIITSNTESDAKCIWDNEYPKPDSIAYKFALKSFVNIDIGVQLYNSFNLPSDKTGFFIMDTALPPTPGYAVPNKYVVHTTLGVVDSITNFTNIEWNQPSFCNSGNVTIGNITWTCRNLDVTTYRDGSVITDANGYTYNQFTGLTTGAWCYYGGNPANGAIYGKLYNWYAVNDPRGLAPSGYHVSSKLEWEETIDYLCGPYYASGKMKEAGTTHWQPTNTNGTNFSDFTALPGGYRAGTISTLYYNLNSRAWFWTSTGSDTDTKRAFGCLMDGANNPGIGVGATWNKTDAFSVRLVKD